RVQPLELGLHNLRPYRNCPPRHRPRLHHRSEHSFSRKSYSKRANAVAADRFLPLRIGIVGVGYSGFDSMTPGLSTRELMFEAASRAYEDAGVDPRTAVQSFVCCTQDSWEGMSITAESMP